MEDYRKKGEHIAIDAVELGKVEGAQLLGARKFIVAENNRRHMEPILEASRSRKIAWLSLLVSVAALLAAVAASVAAVIELSQGTHP